MSNNKDECCTPKGQLPRYVDCIGCDKKPIEIMEKKQSSIEQVFSHIKASKNDIKYWNDSMLVDWLLEQEDRYKAMHKEEVLIAYSKALPITDGVFTAIDKAHDYYNETFGGETE